MAKRIARVFSDHSCKCPFCDYLCSVHPANRNMPWCRNCRVEWYMSRNGKIVFDDTKKTPKCAMGKALNAAADSGGILKIGSKS